MPASGFKPSTFAAWATLPPAGPSSLLNGLDTVNQVPGLQVGPCGSFASGLRRDRQQLLGADVLIPSVNELFELHVGHSKGRYACQTEV